MAVLWLENMTVHSHSQHETEVKWLRTGQGYDWDSEPVGKGNLPTRENISEIMLAFIFKSRGASLEIQKDKKALVHCYINLVGSSEL